MNLKKEKLLNGTYEKFIKISINKLPGNLLEGITAEKIMAYGTTMDEKLLSIQDCRDLVERQLEQGSGMKFVHERFPVTTIISPEEDSAIFVEELIITIKSGKVSHKLFLRVTTALEYSDNKWKVIHFHTSKPDDAKSDTDTWHINEWKRKNEELQKLVNEKTADLVIKNHDLEIEASLERVRAVAMGMRKSENLLDICEILFSELKNLGFDKLRNAMINIHNDNEETFINYDYSDTLGKTITPLYYDINPVIKKQIRQIRKSKIAFSETSFKGDELKEWKKFRKKRGEPDDPRLKNCKALHYYFYSIGTGSIGISTFNPISKKKLELLKRFRNVFDFAYRRYMDVTKAEEQAMEAKIEASLERVRTQSMIMKKPDDLLGVCKSLYNELQSLGFKILRNSQIVIFNNDKETFLNYDYSDYVGANTTAISNNSHPLIQSFIDKIKKNKEAFAEFSVSGKELKEWKKFRLKNGELPDTRLDKAANVYYYFYSIGAGAIGISAFESITKDELEILKRFRNVFDFAYKRYTDVAQAVAQAKEAKIEASLERVRAQAMSINKSGQLSGTSEIIFEELKALGFKDLRNSEILIHYEEKESVLSYYYSDYGVTEVIEIFYNEHSTVKAWAEQIKKSSDAFASVVISEKEIKEWRKYRERIGYLPDPKLNKAKEVYYYSYSTGPGALSISSFKPISGDQLKILERFRNVFGLAYRRYADVALAEEQTREAQIELSLERIRARSMAMHKSEELVDASTVVFDELKKLGIETIRTGVAIVNSSNDSLELWSSQLIEGNRNKILGTVPFKAHTFFTEYYKAWKRKEKYFHYEISGSKVKDYYNKMSSILSYPKKKIFNPRESFYTFFFPEGSLNVVSQNYLTNDECNLMLRFAKVFGQMYKRFLDLQKAEAQAREAQIQLALERIRAKAMAMQKSDELLEVSLELYNQFKLLDSEVRGLTINIINEKERVFEVSFGMFNQSFKLSIDEQIVMSKAYKCWKSGKKSMMLELDRDNVLEFNKIRNKAVGSEIFPLKYKPGFKLIMYISFFSNGMLIAGMGESRPDETIDILQRFASVFDLTYTRFLDLKKAEAQAREAQIEVAMERVRSRTMGMHSSKELQEAAVLLFHQIKDLGVNTGSCGYVIWDNAKKEATAWMSSTEGGIQDPFKLHHTKSKIYREIYSAKESGKDFFVKEVSGGELRKHFDYLTSVPGIGEKIKHLRAARYNFPETIVYNIAFFKQGYLSFHTHELSPEAHDIFKRFANVFEQTYTRFLDLQKAEAQARESQIEVALERVRSRTMGMQKSEELKEVIKIVYQQLRHLDINLDHAGFVVDYSPKADWHFWIADEQDIPAKITHPWFESVWANQFDEAKEKGDGFFTTHLDFEEKNKFYNELLSYVPGLPEASKDFYLSCPALAASTVLLDNVALYIENFAGTPYTDEENRTLMRFGKVFKQTYTRFNDLKQAEAQAREAKIEAALEKVRGKAMAMHNSTDLTEAAGQVFTELNNLGIKPIRSGFVLLSKDNRFAKLYPATSFDNINTVSFTGEFEFTGHPVYEKQYQSWLDKENYFPVLEGVILKSYYKILAKGLSVPFKNFITKNKKQFGTFLPFTEGFLFTWSDEPYPDTDIKILERFKSILDLTIRRYLDLKKAEAQAREAKIEAALERARTQSMLMQHSSELNITSHVFHEQLQLLGIDSEFSFVWLPDEKKNEHLFWTAWSDNKNGSAVIQSKSVIYPLDKTESYTAECFRAWESNEQVHEYFVPPEEINNYFNVWSEILSGAEHLKPEFFNKGIFYCEAFIKYGCFGVETRRALTDEEKKILLRFAIEFERAYTRFLDLKKAEMQARESKIEAALEKVRARTMAMQKSVELDMTVEVLQQQLKDLGILFHSSFIGVIDNLETLTNAESAVKVTNIEPIRGNPSVKAVKKMEEMELGQKSASSKDIVFDFYGAGEDQIPSWITNEKNMKRLFSGLKNKEKSTTMYSEKGEVDCLAYFSIGFIGITSTSEASADTLNLLERFAGVFEQTYTRFLDLQKAETQAREAQIEAALERVRSKAMAMQKSNDVGETVTLMFEELLKLGIEKTIRCGVIIIDKSKQMEVWNSSFDSDGKVVLAIGRLDMTIHRSLQGVYNAWKLKQPSFSYEFAGEDLKEYFRAINNSPDYPLQINLDSLPSKYFNTEFFFKEGAIFSFTLEPLTSEIEQIFIRFAGVFGQTYRRFLDLKKAEVQAREAKIEAAMERVRTQALTMHKSEDFLATALVIFRVLNELGIDPVRSGLSVITDKKKKEWEAWSITRETGENFIPTRTRFTSDVHPVSQEIFDHWNRQDPYWQIELTGDSLKSFLKGMPQDYVPIDKETEKLKYKINRIVFHYFSFPKGVVFAGSEHSFSPDEISIMKKFTNVFSFAYTRYQDLQNAEAQAREAQIEVALERVRSRTMAMQKSDELSETAYVLYQQFMELGDYPDQITIGIINEEKKVIDFWSTADGKMTDVMHKFPYEETDLMNQIYVAWKDNKKSLTRELEGKELHDYIDYRIRLTGMTTQGDHKHDRRVVNVAFFSKGLISISTPDPRSKETIQLLERFAGVFDLTYLRFLDLKKAEAQARESTIEASLERVRSRTLAMQKSDELAETAAVVFKQLIRLGIEPNRLYIGIIKDESGEIEFWITDEDGTRVSNQFTGNKNRNNSIRKMYDGWKSLQKSITIDMQGNELKEYFHHLSNELHVPFKQGLSQIRRVQSIAFFSHGFIGIASPEPQPEETTFLLERFAAVFNLTYARFNDLTIAEHNAEQAQIDLLKLQTEKKRAEEALTELRATQTQLIQSEKMASLGELTAGIAHEIQNPLNFVNNFSEVNTELIEELNEEISKGNFEDAVLIAKDIKENEEKIKHHGKRAEAIVKGMLQHSRSSSGVKEPVNINTLADEYLRLAFHGLRAKDKTFNAKMETDFDESIGEINIVPQEIGRVILNLITNAFYTVTEKKKEEIKDYEPTVSVSTKKSDDKVLISVKDNGNGISQKVMDKIFQPFFTTKPTGQGTGLGLSMSYDIIKAHGGELSVETKEGEGAEFVISIPEK